MSNLLPKPLQKRWQKEQFLRVLTVTMLVCALLGIVSAFTLAPAYIRAHTEGNALSQELKILNEALEMQLENTEQAAISLTRDRVDVLEEIAARSDIISEVIRTTVEKRPSGLTIERFAYTHRDGTGTLQLVGSLESQAQLTEFIENLEGVALFRSVHVPVSTLARADDGVYTLTVTGDF